MRAFGECGGLRQIDIPEGVTHIGEGAFAACINLTNIEIPQGVTYIAKQAFEDCDSLTSIVIPDSVTAIDYYAFMDCSNLATVYYTGSEAEWEQIEIGSSNDELLNAEIVFNYKGEQNGTTRRRRGFFPRRRPFAMFIAMFRRVQGLLPRASRRRRAGCRRRARTPCFRSRACARSRGSTNSPHPSYPPAALLCRSR